MPDLTFNQFPISGKIVDFDQLQTDVNNLNANAVLESRTINGYDLSENRTIYVQDIPSKNLLPNDLIPTTYRGITYTKNSDGSVTCTGSVSVGYSYSEIYIYFQNSIPDGNYILSGCPSGGSESTYRAILWDSNTGARAKAWDGTTNSSSDTGSGSEVQVIASHKMGYNIIIYGSITGTLTFYPMIRPSTAPSGYVPYAKTNVELSKIENESYNVIVSRISSVTGVVHKIGEICYINLKLTATTTAANSPQVITQLPSAIIESALTAIDITSGIGSSIAESIPCGVSDSGIIYMKTITSGHIYAVTGSYVCK